MKKIIYIVTIAAGIFFGVQAINVLRPPSPGVTLSVANKRMVSPTLTVATQQPLYKPVKLSIPKLHIDTTIEEVQNDQTGAMDVPKKAGNVGWYSLGIMPGAKGNAVIAGHLDTPTGAPAVFYTLSDLEIGDEINVIDENNNTLTFVVEKKEAYPTDNFPIQTVFGGSPDNMLNLITCDGTFNKARKLYSQRLVVFSKLKEK